MLNLFSKQAQSFDVVIGSQSKINGDIESEGSVRLDGKLVGSVKAKGEVIVSGNASVEGDIAALSVSIFGKCKGNIEAYGTVQLHSTAEMMGDVKAESFKTETGCTFNGNCQTAPRPPATNQSGEKLGERVMQANKANNSSKESDKGKSKDK